MVVMDNLRHVDISQHVVASPENSSTTNLAKSPDAGYAFIGAAVSTLGVNSIQVVLKTTQNCTVYIEQSPNGSNWDISDRFDYLYSDGNFGTTVQAVSEYARIKVINLSTISSTTFFRLETYLCPIAEPLPRALTTEGRLKAESHLADCFGFDARFTPMNEIRTVTPIRLVGAQFDGTTIDTHFWIETNASGGDSSQTDAQLILETKTTANGSTKIHSLRRARYVSGSSNRFRAVIQLPDTGTANNKRRWGIAWGASMPTITDGAYFQLDGTTISVCVMNGGVETKIDNGSFNGASGATHIPDTNAHTYEIFWTNSSVWFAIDDFFIHKVTTTTDTWSDTMHHHIFIDNVNSGGSSTNVIMRCRAASISRLGSYLTQPTSRYQSGTTAGIVLKYTPGNLHGITVSGVSNNSVITLYDNTAASGTVLWSSGSMGALTTPFFINLFGIPFSIGLTLVIGTANSTVTVVYE